MLPVNLNLTGKAVLIVGGGEVALRKARLFLQEGACVEAVAPAFRDGWDEAVRRKNRTVQPSDLDGMFLVYAAADRPEINRQVTDWAQRRNILCGSATMQPQASFFSMAFRCCGRQTVAFSSGSPMADGQFLDQIEPLMKAQNQRLTWLETLRSAAKTIADPARRKAVIRWLCQLNESQLATLQRARQEKQLRVLFWHGVGEAVAPVVELARRTQTVPVFLNESSWRKARASTDNLFLMQELACWCETMRIPVQGTLMMLSEGVMSQRVRQQFPDAVLIGPLMQEPSWRDPVLHWLRERYPHRQRFCIVHRLPDWQSPDFHWLTLDQLRQTPIQPDGVYIPFFLLTGRHVKQDVQQVLQEAAEKGQAQLHRGSLLENPRILDMTAAWLNSEKNAGFTGEDKTG